MTILFQSTIKLKRPRTSTADGILFHTIVSGASFGVISCRYLSSECMYFYWSTFVFYFNDHFLKEQGKFFWFIGQYYIVLYCMDVLVTMRSVSNGHNWNITWFLWYIGLYYIVLNCKDVFVTMFCVLKWP